MAESNGVKRVSRSRKSHLKTYSAIIKLINVNTQLLTENRSWYKIMTVHKFLNFINLTS